MIRNSIKRLITPLGLMPAARRVARELHTLRQNMLTEAEIEAIYGAVYHQNAGYGSDLPSGVWEPDRIMKREQAKAVLSVLPLKGLLVGGCSSGMSVLAFRALGVDAWGFDISPDLDEIVLPEVRAFVRRGSMTAIPFGEPGRFDALLTTDVLEHVQLKYTDKMMAEVARIGVPWMVHLINHTSIQPDHMTLKPIGWWSNRFGRFGYALREDLRITTPSIPNVYGLNGDPDHAFTFWQKVS